MRPLLQSLAVVLMVAVVGGDVPGHQWLSSSHDVLSSSHDVLSSSHDVLSSSHDVLSAITWATLDQPDPLLSLHGFNLTSPEGPRQADLILALLEELNLTSSDLVTSNDLYGALHRPRKKRNINLIFNQAYIVQMELKLLFPLFNVYAGDNFNIEVPFAYEMTVPTKKTLAAKEEEESHWEEGLSAMATDLEALISMLGLDGAGCVRKTLCEMASMPSPEGLTGEMFNLFYRHFLGPESLENTEDKEESVKDNVLDDESGGVREREKNPSEGETGAVSEWEMYRSGNETDVSGNERVESEADQMKERRKVNNKTKNVDETINMLNETRSDNGEAAEEKRRRWKRTKRDYAAATVHGKTHGNCDQAFPLCPVSLLKLLSDS